MDFFFFSRLANIASENLYYLVKYDRANKKKTFDRKFNSLGLDLGFGMF